MKTRKYTYSRQVKTVTMLLVMLMAAMIFNNVAWQHVHILQDGTLVAHAHPYDKGAEDSPSKQHRHSINELYLLDKLDVFVTLTFLAVLTFTIFKGRVSEEKSEFIVSQLSFLYPGRAPP